ncbi:MAG: hypothetical protein H7257_05710, partial [Taibaiella sp.]|nr:hypothetical protein [Taibaiella sp.]
VNVSCQNGGSCSVGVCKCPTGFGGPTCGAKMVSRYIGYYAGYTKCNNGAQVIDTVFIYGDVPKQVAQVYLRLKSHPYELMVGTVSNNESTYSMSIPDLVFTNYYKMYHVTLQDDSKLTLNTYERDNTIPGFFNENTCTFVGFKHSF